MEYELLQQRQPEWALLVSVDTGEFDAEASLKELGGFSAECRRGTGCFCPSKERRP